MGVLDKILCRLHIPQGEQQDALGALAIAPGTARFLIVVFQIFWHIIMQHKADIGFIYAHAEGVCCNHDPLAVIDKIFLIFAALLRGKARMITGGGNANGLQLLTDGLYRFAGSAIDNAAAIPVVEDIFFNITFFIPRAGHTKIEVGAIKAGGQRKRLVELQQGNDILLDLFRCRCRERTNDRAVRQTGDEFGNFQVAGAEILTPLGHAVGFVHSHKSDAGVHGKV